MLGFALPSGSWGGAHPLASHCMLDIVLNLDAWCVSSSWPLPVNIKLYMTCARCDASVWIGRCCSILDVMPQITHQTDHVLNSLVISTVYPYSAISLHPYGVHV